MDSRLINNDFTDVKKELKIKQFYLIDQKFKLINKLI